MADRSETAPQMLEFLFAMLFMFQWYEFDGCSSNRRGQHGIGNAGIPTILCCIGSVNLIVDIRIGYFHKGDIFYNTASSDLTLIARLHTTEPCGCASIHRADIKFITDAHDPDNDRLSQCAIASEGSDLQLLCGFYLFEFITCPCSHGSISSVMQLEIFLLIPDHSRDQ